MVFVSWSNHLGKKAKKSTSKYLNIKNLIILRVKKCKELIWQGNWQGNWVWWKMWGLREFLATRNTYYTVVVWWNVENSYKFSWTFYFQEFAMKYCNISCKCCFSIIFTCFDGKVKTCTGKVDAWPGKSLEIEREKNYPG